MLPIRCTNFTLILLAFLAIPAGMLAADPDYSRVDDILLGRRTLLQVNDLVIGGTVMKTSDGTRIDDSNITQVPNFQRNKLNPEIFANLTGPAAPDLVYTSGRTVYAVDPVTQRFTALPIERDDFSFAGLAAGDFMGDGHQEVIIASYSGIRIVSAVDPADLTKGLKTTAPWTGHETSFFRPSIAVGHFDGQQPLEIAIAFDNASKDRGELAIFQVDPQTLALQLVRTLVFTHPNAGPVIPTLVAGRFASPLRDQLVLGFYDPANQITFQSYDFDSSLSPTLRDVRTLKGTNIQELNLETGRFDPLSSLDQAALKLNEGRNAVRLGILTFDSSFKINVPTLTTLAGVACSSGGVSAGNFARTEPVPQNPSESQRSLKLQLAISTSNCAGSFGVGIFNVDPPQTAGNPIAIEANPTLSRSLPQTADYGLSIISGDLQGRSVTLGNPTKVVIEDTAQPSVIAAMPPMHIDYIRPSGSSQPALLNLSAIPSGFRTVYETNESGSKQSSNTSTNSWSFGARVGTSASFEIGSVDNGLGLEVAATAQAAEDVKAISEREFGSYSGSSFDASVKTGFADQVWYTDSRFNIYTYPVLGHAVCPASDPKCPNKFPLTIQFSGPDKVESHKVDGNLIPWYQPPWQPGNVFSYPATYEQLQQTTSRIQVLSDAQTSRTDTSTGTERATWTSGSNEAATASIDQNYSFELGFSVTGAWSAGVAGGSASASLNLSGSTGFSDLNKSITSVGRSTGIGVDKPGTFLRPATYNYPFTPYIFGQTKPASVVDNLPQEADVNSFGLLRTAFTADPANSGAGSWWQQTYRDRPDVALNHPSRWHWREVAVENPLPSNCLNVGFGGTNMDCFDPEPRRPDNLWESNYHVMRGFFITDASAAASGPQLTTAKAGDKLRLEARVYNFSFKDTPEGAQVHVRFYAQQIDKDHGHKLIGASILINEVKVPEIPGFSDQAGASLNWVLTGTNFDTTGFDGKYLIFWVVVWIEDANNRLVPEIEGHGLQGIPGTLKSLADVQEEAFSNNVGFYNSAFYVFPSEPEDTGFAPVKPNAEPAVIHVAETNISDKRLAVTQQIDVRAKLIASNNSASGVTALFYDGDPQDGGVVFGLERIPYVAENDSYTVEAPYTASACGKHELFVVVHEGTPDEVSQSLGKLKVDCR